MADFWRLDYDQTLSGILWVLVKELGVNFAAFFEHQRWSFLQFLSSQQCSFLGSAKP